MTDVAMRKPLRFLSYLTLSCGVTWLCGFAAAPFDAAAVPKADIARKQALEACNARKDYKSTAEVIECVVNADREFAHAVRLTDSRPLDTYVAAVKTLDDGIAAGTVKPDEIGKDFRALQASFFKTMNDLYAEYESRTAQDFVAQSEDQGATGRSSGMMNSMDNMGGMGGMGMNGM